MFKVSEVCSVYPDIKIDDVKGVDSKSCVGVVLSDVLAGLTNWTFKSRARTESGIGKDFLVSMDDRNFIHMINSPSVTPAELGVSDAQSPWD